MSYGKVIKAWGNIAREKNRECLDLSIGVLEISYNGANELNIEFFVDCQVCQAEDSVEAEDKFVANQFSKRQNGHIEMFLPRNGKEDKVYIKSENIVSQGLNVIRYVY